MAEIKTRDEAAVEGLGDNDGMSGSIIVTGSSSSWRDEHVRKRLSCALEGTDEDTQGLKDITFIVGEKQEPIKAHKLILSLSSQYFYTLIKPKKDEVDPVICLPTVDPQLFKRLLRFIYTDEIETTDLSQFLDMAKQFGYKRLPLVLLVTMRNSKMTLDKLSASLEMADYVGDDAFGARCRNFIERHAFLVFMSKEFVEFPYTSICTTLSLDGLRLEGEIEVFRAALRWATHQCGKKSLETLKENVREVLGTARLVIRYTQIPYELLLSEVRPSGLLTSSEFVQVLKTFMDSSDNPLNLPTAQRGGITFIREHMQKSKAKQKRSPSKESSIRLRRRKRSPQERGYEAQKMPWKRVVTPYSEQLVQNHSDHYYDGSSHGQNTVPHPTSYGMHHYTGVQHPSFNPMVPIDDVSQRAQMHTMDTSHFSQNFIPPSAVDNCNLDMIRPMLLPDGPQQGFHPMYEDRPDFVDPYYPQPPPMELYSGTLPDHSHNPPDLSSSLGTCLLLNCTVDFPYLMATVQRKNTALRHVQLRNVQIVNADVNSRGRVFTPNLVSFQFLQDRDKDTVAPLQIPDKSFMASMDTKEFLFFEKKGVRWLFGNLPSLGVEIMIRVRGVNYLEISRFRDKIVLSFPSPTEGDFLLENCPRSLRTLCLMGCGIKTPERLPVGSLERVVLYGVEINNMTAMRFLNQCPKLRQIVIYMVTEKPSQFHILSDLRKSKDTLETMALTRMNIYGLTAKGILGAQPFSHLKELYFNGCEWKTKSLEQLPRLVPNLRKLGLRCLPSQTISCCFLKLILNLQGLELVALTKELNGGAIDTAETPLLDVFLEDENSTQEERTFVKNLLEMAGVVFLSLNPGDFIIPDMLLERSPSSGRWVVVGGDCELRKVHYDLLQLSEFLSDPDLVNLVTFSQ